MALFNFNRKSIGKIIICGTTVLPCLLYSACASSYLNEQAMQELSKFMDGIKTIYQVTTGVVGAVATVAIVLCLFQMFGASQREVDKNWQRIRVILWAAIVIWLIPAVVMWAKTYLIIPNAGPLPLPSAIPSPSPT